MKYPHIEVESLFTEMVREYPMASVLTDVIPHPDFLNADFIFHHEKAVAEFKRIEIDNIHSPNNQAKLKELVERFYSEGKIKSKEITEETWPLLPKEFQDEVYDITTRSVKGQVEKANKQIKETKEKLGLNSYKGVLIIVNDGVQSYPPATFIHATFRLLQKAYSGITCFIFFTANVYAMQRGFVLPMNYWISIDMKKDGVMETMLSDNLHAAWKGILSRKTGIPSRPVDLNDVEGFWKARNLPN